MTMTQRVSTHGPLYVHPIEKEYVREVEQQSFVQSKEDSNKEE